MSELIVFVRDVAPNHSYTFDRPSRRLETFGDWGTAKFHSKTTGLTNYRNPQNPHG